MRTNGFNIGVKKINKTESEMHALLIKVIGLMINDKGLEITSYDVNMVSGLIEVIIDNIETNKKLVIAINSDVKEYWVFEYDKINNILADREYTIKNKNVITSKRLVETIQNIVDDNDGLSELSIDELIKLLG